MTFSLILDFKLKRTQRQAYHLSTEHTFWILFLFYELKVNFKFFTLPIGLKVQNKYHLRFSLPMAHFQYGCILFSFLPLALELILTPVRYSIANNNSLQVRSTEEVHTLKQIAFQWRVFVIYFKVWTSLNFLVAPLLKFSATTAHISKQDQHFFYN